MEKISLRVNESMMHFNWGYENNAGYLSIPFYRKVHTDTNQYFYQESYN